MHTPAKGAGPNKGLGGSNPPFSAMISKKARFLMDLAFFFIIFFGIRFANPN